jgi:hypothetical protein
MLKIAVRGEPSGARLGVLFFGAVLMAVLSLGSRAEANQTPAPSVSSKPIATPQPPPAIPWNFDPCGGPLELLNKVGNGTACVFVRNEVAVTAQYGSATIPANSQININTRLGSRTFGVSSAAHAFGYPSSVIYVGVGARAQIAFTPPSFAQVNSSTLGALTGNDVLAAGATDMQFQYKQLVWVDLAKFTMFAIDLDYKAPTGSPSLRGTGPSYTLNPIFTQPLPHSFGVTLAFPFTDSASMDGPECSRATGKLVCTPGAIQRGWAFSPQFVPYWESRGGTLLALLVQHNFQPSSTPVVFNAAQLIGRHFEVSISEGGFSSTVNGSGPLNGLISASSKAYPSLFTAGVNYLFGSSDLPAALQQ